jgi:hypothetical protein
MSSSTTASRQNRAASIRLPGPPEEEQLDPDTTTRRSPPHAARVLPQLEDQGNAACVKLPAQPSTMGDHDNRLPAAGTVVPRRSISTMLPPVFLSMRIISCHVFHSFSFIFFSTRMDYDRSIDSCT